MKKIIISVILLSIVALINVPAQIEEARKRAVDFDCPAYFPGEWVAVESQYNTGNLTNEGVYDELFYRAVPLYALAREDEVYAARDQLIATGLTATYPEYLWEADEIALSAVDKYEAGDYYAARDTAVKALYIYEALNGAAGIYFTREELIAMGLTGTYPEYLERTDGVALSAVDEFEAENYPAAERYATKASYEYEAMIEASRIYLTREELIAVGLAGIYPEYLERTDEIALTAVDHFEAENYQAAEYNATTASYEYNALNMASWIYLFRQEIINQNYIAYDPENFAQADEIALKAVDLFEAGNYDAAEEYAEEAFYHYNRILMASMAENAMREPEYSSERSPVTTEVVSVPPSQQIAAVPLIERSSDGVSPLPSQYTVRPWSSSRDCLWNIAGYPWVYGDPYQWRLLYNANRSKMPEPDNPNLIEPGMVLDVPSIMGEIRQGMWDPTKTYNYK
ncbi:MAG: hypothetical protein LBH42_00580 [Treponema sp.]|nr:hypothetical protein [Treponema sp.]